MTAVPDERGDGNGASQIGLRDSPEDTRRAGRLKAKAARRNSQERSSREEVNSIRPKRTPFRAALPAGVDPPPPEPDSLVDARAQSDRRAEPRSPAKAGTAESDPWTVPGSVRDRFTQDGHRFYFADGSLAFRDHGRKLTTPSENTEVIHSLVEIARTRGWHEITVGGTERFRQEAWRQGRLAGLEVRGYRPSEAERASVIRSISRQTEASRAEMPSPSPSTPAEAGLQSGAESASTRAGDGGRPPEALIIGRLLDHGPESYRFDPHQEPSYFVRIQTPDGKREIWGKDLERALTKSLTQPKIGDEIALRRTGADSVTVKRRERNADGQVLTEKELDTHRNRWVIEKREFLQARAMAAQVLRNPTIEPRRAVKQYPELAGTYLNLQAAQIAARTLRDPQDRKRFVALVRQAMADSVARGEPLQPVRLRERAPPGAAKDRVPLSRE